MPEGSSNRLLNHFGSSIQIESYNHSAVLYIRGSCTPQDIGRYEPVSGLEVHVQLARPPRFFVVVPSLFSGRRSLYQCVPVCLGHRGRSGLTKKLSIWHPEGLQRWR